jgi:hypothetical protein
MESVQEKKKVQQEATEKTEEEEPGFLLRFLCSLLFMFLAMK